MVCRKILVALCLSLAFLPSAAHEMFPDEADANAARALDRVLTDPSLTYSARTQDRAFLISVIDRYLDTIDPSRIVFTAEDEAKFKEDPRWVRAALQGRALAAPLRIFEIYRQRFDEAMSLSIAQVSGKPQEFSLMSQWQVDRSSATRARSGDQWLKLWAASVQHDRISLLDAGHDPAMINKDLAGRYEQSQAVIEDINKDRILDIFLDSYARSFDPHSNYLPPAAADGFAASISLSMEGIGVVFSRESTGVMVKEVVKGGAADKAGVVVGDRLSAFGPNEKSLKPVEGLDLDTIVSGIRGKKGTVIVLELSRAETGKLDRIKITRDIIQFEDQKVSWEMKDVAGKLVAVISLPLFYHDFQATNGEGNSATKDVEAALVEAKNKGAQGIVLNLSGNGGGSLMEAVNLVGLFSPPTAVVQIRGPDGALQVVPSDRAEPVWTGPLAVLIDGGSASASEIVAAALQDIGRAAIIGERSYGKGTVQALLDLDRATSSPPGTIGQVKLTTAQFFRPSGVSTQLIGVEPDIALGASSDALGERAYINALPAASVDPVSEYENIRTLGDSQIKKITDASVSRIDRTRPVSVLDYVPLRESEARNKQALDLIKQAERNRELRTKWPEEAANILVDIFTLS